jgi:hypothetical protein
MWVGITCVSEGPGLCAEGRTSGKCVPLAPTPDGRHNPQEEVSEVKKRHRVPATMKYLPLLLIAALLSACDISEEDRNFYYNGWMKPERASNQRIYGGDVSHERAVDPASL